MAKEPDKAATQTTPAAKSDTETPRDDRDVRLEALEEQLAALNRQIAANTVSAPDVQAAKESEATFKRIAAHLEKGYARIAQEACDRDFPSGRHRFKCSLDDGNLHPTFIVSADTDTDAEARYKKVCGITANEKPVKVERC
jgi:hypothetical protein